MIKKIKSNKGYIFTFEAVIVAFIFLSIFYLGYSIYSHNLLTGIEEKRDTEQFHKALLLKDLFLKKYEFPGNYKEDYIQNFTDILNLNEKTFDPINNFTNDSGKFCFVIYPNEFDDMLDNSNISLNKITFTFNGYNFTVYSNVFSNISLISLPNISNANTIIYFKENAYIPKITGITKNKSEVNLYGCNGDHIYFRICDGNVISASARVITDNRNIFSSWSDWRYAAPILVINRLNIPLNDYDIKVIFDSRSYINDGLMKPDCGDIRFIDSNGNELNYWIEPNTINTQRTVVWVKVNLAPNEHKLIYMLYGNPNAKSKSNGENTFVFFDNFSEENLNKWIYNFRNPLFINDTYPNGINFTYLSLDYNYYNVNNLTNDNEIYITTGNYDSHTAVRFRANFHKRYEEWGGYYHGYTIYDRQMVSNYHWGGEFLRFESSTTDENHIEYRILPDNLYNNWNTYEIQRNENNNVNLLINDNEFWSLSNYVYNGNLPVSFYAREYDTSQGGGYNPPDSEKNGNISIDWVFVRKYYEPEPDVRWLASEVIFTVNGYVYRKPLLTVLQPIDITPNIKSGINKIEILSSPLPVEFKIETDDNTDFYYLTLSPRNITIMVNPND
ncbi:conserved protein of unknown function [Methanocaldococcus lauensis]|uniref:DUF2341 domain-containing protein n=1 Tax=Methanocaldococcus lauensis TaxID=2546128 RepID=A0A8D6SWK8_9EURY|nr:DUF2341 domain-containing protein [Methanocaldococcus lauensis]CAB3289483.1 conserved protein of unknown function [Methanocaldococcus lauensis]